MTDNGFIGAFRLLTNGIGIAAAFLATPKANALTWPMVQPLIQWDYGLDLAPWIPTLWMVVVGFLIFAAVRMVLLLLVSLGGLLLALAVLPRRPR